jgi:hypothetical protein
MMCMLLIACAGRKKRRARQTTEEGASSDGGLAGAAGGASAAGMGLGGVGGGEDGSGGLGGPSGGAIIQYNPAFNAEFEHLLRAVGSGPPPGGMHGLDVTQALGGLQLNHGVSSRGEANGEGRGTGGGSRREEELKGRAGVAAVQPDELVGVCTARVWVGLVGAQER